MLLTCPAVHRVFLPLIACLAVLLHGPVAASVVLTGTRIIYPAGASEKTLQLSNADAHPWLVQAWLDAGDETSTPETVNDNLPFVLSPPIFRMDAHGGQALRVMLADTAALPADRESLFYFNFTQIPALDAQTQGANRLMVLIRSRVKLFYRPRQLARPNLRQIACGLRFHVQDEHLTINNPSPFHAVVRKAELHLDGQSVALLQGEMLAPFSEQRTPLPEGISAITNAQLHVTLINDYGADESQTCPWG